MPERFRGEVPRQIAVHAGRQGIGQHVVLGILGQDDGPGVRMHGLQLLDDSAENMGLPGPAEEDHEIRPQLLQSPDESLAEGIESRSEEQTSELQSLMRTSYAVFC